MIHARVHQAHSSTAQVPGFLSGASWALGQGGQFQMPLLPWQRPPAQASCRAAGLDSYLASICDHRVMGQGRLGREGQAL